MADLNVALILRFVDKATAPMKKAKRSLDWFNKQGRDSYGKYTKSPRAMLKDSLAPTMKHLASTNREVRKLTRNVTALAGMSLYGFKRQFFDLAVSLERYEAQLTALTGSKKGAKQAMGWIVDFAKNTPADVDTLMRAFTQLKAYGMDPMAGSMQTIMDTTARLGYSNQKLMQIGLAIGQIHSKGRIMGQEANQLGEHGINVYGLLGKELGKTAAQMRKMGESGELGLKHIKMLMRVLGEQGAGAAEKQMNTLGGMVSNLGDAWWRFRTKIIEGKGGLGKAMGKEVKAMLAWVTKLESTGKLDEWAESTGKAFIKFGKHLKDTVFWIKDLTKAVWAVLEPIGGLKFAITAVALAMSYNAIVAVTSLMAALVSLGWTITTIVVPPIAAATWAVIKFAVATTARLVPAILRSIPALAVWSAQLFLAVAPFLALTAAAFGVLAALKQLSKYWDQLDVLEGLRGMADTFKEIGFAGTFNKLFDMGSFVDDFTLPGQGAPLAASAGQMGNGQLDININQDGVATVVGMQSTGFDMTANAGAGFGVLAL